MDTIIYNPIFWIFISYGIGQISADYFVKNRKATWFDNHNYVGDKTTKWLGVLVLGWVIRNTILGLFNKKLKLKGKADLETLQTLKREMGYAEAGHLVAFYFLLIVNISFMIFNIDWDYIVLFFFLNIVFNMYLVLLQQYNKRRIDFIIDSNF